MDHEDATMASDWYYSRSGNKFGPLSSAELKTKADSGELRPDDLIWKEGMIEWKPARSAKGLITSLPATLPPLPTSLSDAEEDEELGEISQDGFLSRTRRAMIRSVLISVPLVGLGFYGYMKVTGQPVETALKTVVAASKSTVTKLASNTEPENKATGNEPALIESDEVATSEKSNAKGQDSSASSKVTEAGSQNQQNQEIVADGSGQTSDDALKDAFRNAVRQVVGAVVDTETLVKNDEIIDDKVLTYSAGFIKGYEEVQGSKKVKDGLHRIKIRAQVERKGVIAKLEAAKVTVKGLDGKGLFAKVVTELETEKDATELLKKQFEGFPQSCVGASVIGQPRILNKNDDSATVEVIVQVGTDLNAYKSFSERITAILAKMATKKGEFTVKYKSFGRPVWSPIRENGYEGGIDLLPGWIPSAFDGPRHRAHLKQDTLTLVIATSWTTSTDRIDYGFYQIDKILQPVLVEVAVRRGKGKLQLLDEKGKSIATEL